jgi:hypothetical protein
MNIVWRILLVIAKAAIYISFIPYKFKRKDKNVT